MGANADIQLDEDHVRIIGDLIANVRVKWESIPQDMLGGVFYLPPKGVETEVPLGLILGRIISLLMDTRQLVGNTGNNQSNWRWCVNCEGLFFAGHATQGVCPKKGGPHVVGTSGNYELHLK